MRQINFDEIIKAGSLFEGKVMNHYYSLYAGKLSRLQAHALSLVCNNPGLLSRDIAEAQSVPKQYASQIVKKLLLEGMICNQPDVKDRRAQLLYPTKLGKEVLAEYTVKSNADFWRKTSALTSDEMEELLTAFSTLRRLLEKID